ncbi:hypothetical protein ACFU9X_33885 [Streptomyces atratus]|uniref:hypothetical protein n=1 Tax=Streptomyces atratus TaxID=1893 RepID=UPI0036B420E5
MLVVGAEGVVRGVLPGEARSAGPGAGLPWEVGFVEGVLDAGAGGVLDVVDGAGV